MNLSEVSNATEADQKAVKKALLKMIRYHSKHCLEGYIFSAVDEQNADYREIPIYAFWLSFVLLATDHMNIILKTHFNFSSIQPILKKIFSEEDEKITQQMAESFMNEYSNLFGTKVKNTLFDIGVPTGMSLPVLTRGFDNYLFEEYFRSAKNLSSGSQNADLFQYTDVWRYQTDQTTIHCSVEIDILSMPAFDKLKQLIEWDPKQNIDAMLSKMEFLL